MKKNHTIFQSNDNSFKTDNHGEDADLIFNMWKESMKSKKVATSNYGLVIGPEEKKYIKIPKTDINDTLKAFPFNFYLQSLHVKPIETEGAYYYPIDKINNAIGGENFDAGSNNIPYTGFVG